MYFINLHHLKAVLIARSRHSHPFALIKLQMIIMLTTLIKLIFCFVWV